MKSSDRNNHWFHEVLASEPKITQDELRRFRELQSMVNTYRELRMQIREKVLSGEALEPGALRLEVTKTLHRSFKFNNLAELIGERETQKLKDRLVPKEVIRLDVIEKCFPEIDI